MKNWRLLLPAASLLLLAGQAAAQTDANTAADKQQASEAEYAARLKDAESRMAEAARQIAEITSQRMPNMQQIERRFEFTNRPVLGITIDSSTESGPVEGVEVKAVTPGSAADDAGLRAGDVMTSVNGEDLTADNSASANEKLLDFMAGVEEGDALEFEYLRNGNVGKLELTPRAMESHVFSWIPNMQREFLHVAPGAPNAPVVIDRFGFPWAGSGLGDMELVELNEGLGRYFGTDKGLLVVSAPASDAFELEEGDVIQNIDGREPNDVRHAMRILGSYQSGESLKLGIMRDKKKRTIEVEIPADYRGSRKIIVPPTPTRAPVAALPRIAPIPEVADPAT